MKYRARAIAGWSTLAVVWAGAIAVALAAFPLAREAERQSIEPADPVSIAVGSRETDLPRAVVVSVERGAAPEIRVSAGGTLTQLYLTAGSAVQDGKPVIAVDGTNVLAMVAERPLWRDLSVGDKGQDVADLGAYLVRLGLLDAASSDDTFGPKTQKAVTDLQRILGVDTDGVFRRSYVVFVPGGGEVAEVVVRPGDALEPQTPVLSLTPSVTQITMRGQEGASLSALSDSPIVMRRGEAEIELSSPAITAESFPAVVDLFATAAPLTDSAELTQEFDGAVVRLRDPITVGTVPSSAVYVDSAGKMCIFLQPSEAADVWEPQEAMSDTLSSEVGVVYVQPSLSGMQVLANPAAALGASRQCS